MGKVNTLLDIFVVLCQDHSSFDDITLSLYSYISVVVKNGVIMFINNYDTTGYFLSLLSSHWTKYLYPNERVL